MFDRAALKKKFKAVPKGGPMHRKSSKAVVRAIAREYELKMIEVRSAGAPTMKRGILFYGVIIFGLVVLGTLVLATTKGNVGFGKKRIERKALMARKAMDSLSVALGRYKFHVGDYPTTAEGLVVLTYRKPDDLRKIRRAHPGWNGPYIDHLVKDPWGHDYVYETRPDGGYPILYSCGPDGRLGTLDDVLPDLDAFERAFRDTSWTNHWAPAELRGIIVAPDEETKRRVNEDMKRYD